MSSSARRCFATGSRISSSPRCSRASCGAERVIAAIDAKGGRVAVKGWRETVPLSAADAARALEPYCSEFLYTHVDKEGLMQGTDMGAIRTVRDATSRRVVAAGGITTQRRDRRARWDGRRRRRRDGDLYGAVEDLKNCRLRRRCALAGFRRLTARCAATAAQPTHGGEPSAPERRGALVRAKRLDRIRLRRAERRAERREDGQHEHRPACDSKRPPIAR